ncbi:MAG: hypothetical protein R8M45_00535 [Ghiorsea sp.]
MSIQQALSLAIPDQQHYGNWVHHPQVAEACGRIALWLVQGGHLWLSSTEQAGKSHFIQALSQDHPQLVHLQCAPQQLSSLQQLKTWLNHCQDHAYWALDLPAGDLSPAVAYATFHLIERAKQMNRALLISWRCPKDNNLPPELSSRLQILDHAHMAPPQGDAELQQVLLSVLHAMQWEMKDAVLRSLLQHTQRSLPALLHAVQCLDRYSRQHRVKINGKSALAILKDMPQDG